MTKHGESVNTRKSLLLVVRVYYSWLVLTVFGRELLVYGGIELKDRVCLCGASRN